MNKIMFDLAWWIKPGTAHHETFKAESTNWYNLDRSKNEGDIKSAWRHVRTRLYFTSLSHLNSVFFLFVYGISYGYLPSMYENIDDLLSLDYLGNFVMKLYEDFS